MGHYVTIEGSLTPTTVLARGVRKTVAVTDEVRKLVQIGGAVVVDGSLEEPAAPGNESSSESTAQAETSEETEPDSAADSPHTEADTETSAKRVRGARRSPAADPDAPQTKPDGAS
ncbi:Uncharacterised protein [Mycobacteroides abscessus subsp. bolletii]|uniref:hypothetical protein n=1 Tax=Mycobacteroides abscessus TaxID=36809 RepID=UPI0009A799BD|nr:hypothetical protein [Mycobacteroides abscessus]SKS49738.1 Uncharacterised protein [Mycobacteroides abscessus subsp. bolletii]SKY54152.1 Uncharacterised protein [Mycobacteroides abscessus subsp. bolletii]